MAVCALALAAPAQAATPTASVKPPAGGDLTLAHLVLATKGGSGTPKLALTNKSKLAKQLTVIGGVKKLKKNSYLASVAVLNRKAPSGKLVASASAGPALKLVMPKGMRFSKFTSKVIAKNLLSNSATPKFCGAVPTAFGYVAKKTLAGSLLPGFPTPYEYVRAGYLLNCPSGYEERAEFAAALRGEPAPSSQPPGEEEEEEGEGGGTPTSSTLRAEGTVVAEGGGVYRYEIRFNEPVFGFRIEAGAPVRCPTEYGDWKASECDPLGNSQAADGGGTSMPCKPGYYSYEFSCETAASGDRRSGTYSQPTIAAGTTISGRYKVDPGATVKPGTVRIYGHSPNGTGQGDVLSGP